MPTMYNIYKLLIDCGKQIYYVFMEENKRQYTQKRGLKFNHSDHFGLDYTELQDSVKMLQLIAFDSGQFTRPELWLYSTDLHEIKSVIFLRLCV